MWIPNILVKIKVYMAVQVYHHSPWEMGMGAPWPACSQGSERNHVSRNKVKINTSRYLMPSSGTRVCTCTYILTYIHTNHTKKQKQTEKNLLLYKVQQGRLAGALWTGPGLAADSPTLCLPYGHITGRYLVLRTPVTYCPVFPLQQVN